MEHPDFNEHACLINEELIRSIWLNVLLCRGRLVKINRKMLNICKLYIKIYNNLCELNNIALQDNLLYLSVMISSLF